MAKTELILSIDVGTQSVRAVIIDLKGNITDIKKTVIEAYYSNQPGWAEQYPDYFWKNLSETCRKLFSKTVISKTDIKAVTLTTQRGTVVNSDINGKPLRPAISWLDQRQAKVHKYPKGLARTSLRMINMKEAVTHAVKNAECNWIIQNQPEIWEKTDKFIYLSGWLTYKLTGNFTDSVGNMVGYMPFDYKRQRWASENHRNTKMFPVSADKLCSLVKPGEILGYITKETEKLTGIPEGLPLFAAASDKASEVLGSGVYTPEVACLSYGTTATVQTTHKNYYEVIPFFPAYPGAIQDYFNTEIMIFRGFWMVNWFKEEFGYKEIEIAEQKGLEPEQIFDEMIKDIPPGSMGLTLQPYWSPGVKVPGTEAKGAIIGFGDVHTRAHIYRAILEGLAYALKEGLQRTEKRTKTKIEKIIVSGGGSQSEQAMQMTADIFNLPVEKPHTYETSALGAAINAAVGMNYYNSYEEAVKNMCRTGSRYTPNEKNKIIYEKLYTKVYYKMYGRLKGLYHIIRDITGYPEKI
ncbi:MAG: carbohydrate kinase [Chlorobi bacterium]|nr:carbohydrate kinase [Chlorobiota bacterium]